MTGDVTIQPDAPLLIMTTEIFRNTIFEDPDRLDGFDFAIFDEVHYLDDRERGTVWEESIIFAPPHIRIVGLSATVPNVDELAAWIEEVRGLPGGRDPRARAPRPADRTRRGSPGKRSAGAATRCKKHYFRDGRRSATAPADAIAVAADVASPPTAPADARRPSDSSGPASDVCMDHLEQPRPAARRSTSASAAATASLSPG